MKLSMRLPFQPGVTVAPEAAARIKGQFVHVLMGGQAVLGAVTDTEVMGDPGAQTLWVELEAEDFPGLALNEAALREELSGEVTQDLHLDWSQAQEEPDVPR